MVELGIRAGDANSILDGNIGRRHQIAPTLGGDVCRADATPSQVKRALNCVDGDEGLTPHG